MGTTIGGGAFALPYVFSQSGWLPSLLGLLFLGILMILLNLFYSLVILATDGDHQLLGYVRIHLGKNPARLAFLSILLSLNGALLAYTVLGGEFLALALGQLANQFYHLWFYLLAIFLFWQGFKRLVKIETWLTVALLLLMLSIPIFLAKFIQLENYSLVSSRPLFFWGATLFALTGFSVVPEVEEALRRERWRLTLAIVIGSILPIFIYWVFGFSIWGITGPMTTADALSGLVHFSPVIVRIGAAVGLLALMTSFLGLVNVAKEVYYRDLKLDQDWARILAVLPPLLGVFFPMGGFVEIISLTGGIGLAISGTLICLMTAKVKPRLKWLAWSVALVFVLGALTQLA